MNRLINDVCPHYPHGVPDGHVCDAKIVLVGEAGGEREDETGLPFQGMAGQHLDKLLASVGIKRRELYITNVLPYRPNLKNDIKLVPRAEIARASGELIDRIRSRFSGSHPNVVVPTGGTALYALTGKTGIQKWRGSILEADMLWAGQKSIAVLHPAFLLRTPGLVKTCIADWTRIRSDSQFRDLRLPQWDHTIYPTQAELEDFYDEAVAHPDWKMAVDIETTRGDFHIICVGFCIDGCRSITILWRDREWIRALCELPNVKVLQNGFFDYCHLHRHGIDLVNYTDDIACKFHCLDPNAGPNTKGKGDADGGERSRIKAYSLAYMASIFTREPYWKDEAKDESDGTTFIDNDEWRKGFMRYNGKDVVSTHVINSELDNRLRAVGRLDTYYTLYASLFNPLIDLMLRGVRTNVREAEAKRNELLTAQHESLAAAEQIAGRPLHSIHTGAQWYECEKCHTKTGGKIRHKTAVCPKGGVTRSLPCVVKEGSSISGDMLKEYLYGSKKSGGLGLTARRKKGSVTADEAALRSLRLSFPDICGEVVGKILEFRRQEKLATFVSEGVIGPDGRIHSQYKQLVLTGRLSSSAAPDGTGANLQNTDATLMYLLRPDRGRVFLFADESQAEDRVVKALTGVPHLVEEARSDPSEFDTHTTFASRLFSFLLGRQIDAVKGGPNGVSPEQRYLSKRGRHGYNYGLGPVKLAEIIAKEGPKVGVTRVVTIKECEEILKAIGNITPEIDTHYHRWIRDILRSSGILALSWGTQVDYSNEYRFAQFSEQRETIFRAGYSFIPQGEVGRLVNQWGIIPVSEELDDKATLNLQRHDEGVWSVAVEDLYEVATFVRDHLERPRVYTLGSGYPRTELIIPVEFAVGLNAGKDGRLEWKRLPDQMTFERQVDEWLTKSLS